VKILVDTKHLFYFNILISQLNRGRTHLYCRSANVGYRFNLEKNRQIKKTPSFQFHCNTYNFTKFHNFEQQICEIKTSPSCRPDCQNCQPNTLSSFTDLQYKCIYFSSITAYSSSQSSVTFWRTFKFCDVNIVVSK
jgi:hypothetical protein